MQENIGKVTLDLTHYPGKDLYSDGAIEDEILAFVQDNPPSAYEEYIAKRKNWAVLYHLSYIRQNILAGVGISKDDTVLEIGSGMGAIMDSYDCSVCKEH